MTTYIYETILADDSTGPKVFGFQQRMTDKPLTHHPETGEPVRRIISGGLGYMQKGEASALAAASCGCH